MTVNVKKVESCTGPAAVAALEEKIEGGAKKGQSIFVGWQAVPLPHGMICERALYFKQMDGE